MTIQTKQTEKQQIVPWSSNTKKKKKANYTYIILSHGGLSRMWQKTWSTFSTPSAISDSHCQFHSLAKWAKMYLSVDLWAAGMSSTRSTIDFLEDVPTCWPSSPIVKTELFWLAQSNNFAYWSTQKPQSNDSTYWPAQKLQSNNSTYWPTQKTPK